MKTILYELRSMFLFVILTVEYGLIVIIIIIVLLMIVD